MVVFLTMNSLVIASVRRTRRPYFIKQRCAGRESLLNRGYIAVKILLPGRRSYFRFSSPWRSRTGGVRYDGGSFLTEAVSHDAWS